MIESLRKLLSILDPASRRQFLYLIAPMLLVTALELLSIGMVLPLVQVVLLGKTEGWIAQTMLQALPGQTWMGSEIWIVSIFAGLFVGKNILLLANYYIINYVTQRKVAIFMSNVFRAYLLRPLEFHFWNNSATLLRNVKTGSDMCIGSIRLILNTILELTIMVSAIILLVLIEPQATLAMAVFFIVLGVVYSKLASPVFKNWGKHGMYFEGSLIQWINQSFGCLRDIKLLHAEDYAHGIISDIGLSRARYVTLEQTATNIPRLMIESLVIIGSLGLILWFSSQNTTTVDVIPLLALYTMAAMRLMPALNRVLTSITEIRHRGPYIDTIYADLQEHNDYEASTVSQDRPHNKITFQHDIEFKDINFTYKSANRHSVADVSLRIAKGSSVGIVGVSGAGKSTLIDIFLGLLRPGSGQVLVDGVDIYSNLRSWQAHLGYVPQDVNLIDDTLRHNIAFGLHDDQIDNARLSIVINTVRLEDFIASLADGVETLIGEHGARLSGGQRQRIAIGRALYRDPDVLVFDEATSALDNVTEREISRAIETLAGDKTILIVAHRLSTVRKCDRIVLMKEGRIEAAGTYDELLATNEEFRHLAQLGDMAMAETKDVSP